MKIYKVADIVNGKVCLNEKGNSKAKTVILTLSNADSPEAADPNVLWWVELTVGESIHERQLTMPLRPLLSASQPLDEPQFICGNRLVFFRNRLFLPERPPMNVHEADEVVLRAKKAVYAEDAELSRLRSEAANLEAAIEFTKSGSRREPIPDDVKLLVWTRDGGACVRCGSRQDLHFDHIIPFAKGGGRTEANIQILCEKCNLKKSDNIAT